MIGRVITSIRAHISLQGLFGFSLGSVLTSIALLLLPFWIAWPGVILVSGLLYGFSPEHKENSFMWFVIGSFIPLYYVVLGGRTFQ